jgi:hypothetical protein
MELNFETLEITVHEPKIVVVTMNRPQALNAMNTQMMKDLRDCFQEFYEPGKLHHPDRLRRSRLLFRRRPQGTRRDD